MTGIAHAWTLVGDRCLIDRDHDTVSLDALEVIYVDKPDDGVAAMVPCQLEVVSLWYRHDPAYGERQQANVCVLSWSPSASIWPSSKMGAMFGLTYGFRRDGQRCRHRDGKRLCTGSRWTATGG
jgi:hypothetical protein